jgi:O-antigen ligase
MGRNKRRNQQQSPSLIDFLGQWIIYIMIGVIPHIYYYTGYKTKPSELKYFHDEYYADLYMLAKSRVFLVLSVALLCIFLYQVFSKRIEFIKDKINIGAGIFAAIVILSSVMSEYQDMVYWGAKDRHEGMWVWLAYVSLFVISRHYGKNKEFVNNTLKVFVYSASIMGVFGLMQMFGYDIYTEGPLRWLCFPMEIAANIEMYMTSNTTDTLIVGALYNSNYYGVYMAMAALSALSFSISEEGKRQWILLGLGVINYGAMIASGSEAALLGFAAALFLYAFYYGQELWRNKKLLIAEILSFVLMDRSIRLIMEISSSSNANYIYMLLFLFTILGVFLSWILVKYEIVVRIFKKYSLLISILVLLFAIVVFNVIYGLIPVKSNLNRLEDFQITNNELYFEYDDGDEILIKCMPDKIVVFDGKGNLLETYLDGNNQMSFRSVQRKHVIDIKYYIEGYALDFVSPLSGSFFYDGESVYYYDSYKNICNIDYPNRSNYYYNKGETFSTRGYIWSVYLPIAQENMLFGNGLDTYMNIFPQNDYIGKSNYLTYRLNMIIDKPHSTYIMILVSTGLMGIFVVSGLIIYMFKNQVMAIDRDYSFKIHFFLVVCILVAGIFNDSVIPITLLFSCYSAFMCIE